MSSTSFSPQSPNISQYFSLSSCKSVGTIKNELGEVVKGVCELNSAFSYDEAVRICESIGMELFVAEKVSIYKSFMKFVSNRYKNFSPSVWSEVQGLWINGRKSDGNWMATKDSSETQMNSSFYEFIGGSAEGDCMAVKNKNGFKVASYDCKALYSPICEFDNKF
jgi:hypothetical protein